MILYQSQIFTRTRKANVVSRSLFSSFLVTSSPFFLTASKKRYICDVSSFHLSCVLLDWEREDTCITHIIYASLDVCASCRQLLATCV